jgi:hypothetical protein
MRRPRGDRERSRRDGEEAERMSRGDREEAKKRPRGGREEAKRRLRGGLEEGEGYLVCFYIYGISDHHKIRIFLHHGVKLRSRLRQARDDVLKKISGRAVHVEVFSGDVPREFFNSRGWLFFWSGKIFGLRGCRNFFRRS